MKPCPFCAEEIRDEAVKCKHCGSMLGDTSQSSAARDTLDGAATVSADAMYGGRMLANRYRIEQRLGAGGMGEVWRALDTELGEMPVAIKVLPPVLARNPHSIKALKREAAIALRLTHAQICRLHTFHSDGDLKFLVMEYLEGQTLEELLHGKPEGRMSLEELLPIAQDVSAAIDYAHAQQPPVLHRDIKPSNIMVTTDGRAKVLDFGIARELKDSMTRVTGKETSGTLLYMSPEQFNGATPTPASDVYSLAATLYECFAGHPPFYQGSVGHQLLHLPPPSIDGAADHVNAALQAGLAKAAEERPKNANALLNSLKQNPKAQESVRAAPPLKPASKHTTTATDERNKSQEKARSISPVRGRFDRPRSHEALSLPALSEPMSKEDPSRYAVSPSQEDFGLPVLRVTLAEEERAEIERRRNVSIGTIVLVIVILIMCFTAILSSG